MKSETQDKNPLSFFNPIIAEWFCAKYSTPTDIQQKAWPLIANGQHTLVSAPTGTGKTLTAFLWALNQLITGIWNTGSVRVLYISPLKALNSDIRDNLLIPLSELQNQFLSNNIKIPQIRIQTRSGDTSFKERRSMLKQPPEILITTPESLNLILSSPQARKMLTGLKTIILDEIHAVASSKRGSYLMTAVERLELLSKGFQRIALSATVRPLETVASFIGGSEFSKSNDTCTYLPRPVQIVSSTAVKKIRVTVEGVHVDNTDVHSENDIFWRTLSSRIRSIIDRNSSTLIFVNNRRLAERLTLYINEGREFPLAYSHHGSLSKELRFEVEHKLKAGELKAIVATSTLEMGIDVGAIDEVVLVGTPALVSAALQRIGRAGHSVHRTSCGTLMPLHGLDCLYAAILASLSVNGNIEAIKPVRNPLDVLAQVLMSIIGIEVWDVDELFNFIKTAAPYLSLPRSQFDSVLSMLAGRYQESRIRDLRPRILLDSTSNKVVATSGTLPLIYNNIGTIPDRGYYGLRLRGSDTLIGELDEEFVWERRPGDTFLLGTQRWQITDIGTKDVEVVPWHGAVSMSPFWKADAPNRSFHVSNAILKFLEYWNDNIHTQQFTAELTNSCFLDQNAALKLSEFLQLQKAFTGPVLPHRHNLIVEHVHGSDTDPFTLIHTFWGNPINYPYMLAFQSAYQNRHGKHIEVSSSNDIIYLGALVDPEDIRMLVSPGDLDHLLRDNLEKSNYFGARFRENAGIALLLPRFNRMKRMPLWLTRERSKKLFEAIRNYDDFPLLVETWRSCLTDDFDLNTLIMLLNELRNGEIEITAVNTSRASPFCGSISWQVTNTKLYQDDTPYRPDVSSVNSDIIKSVVFSESLRPAVKKNILILFLERLQRTAPGYAPSNALELVEWIKDRICITYDQWNELFFSFKRDSGKSEKPENISDHLHKLCRIRFPGAEHHVVTAIESLPRLCRVLGVPFEQIHPECISDCKNNSIIETIWERSCRNKKSSMAGDFDTNKMISQWLEFYGPVNPLILTQVFGISNSICDSIISQLVSQKIITENVMIKDESGLFVCDSQNLERLFRMMRNEAKSTFKPLPLRFLQLFLAEIQCLLKKTTGDEGLKKILELFFGYPASAIAWEQEIFSTRIDNYLPAMIDSLFSQYGLQWVGSGRKKITFCLTDEVNTMVKPPVNESNLPECDSPLSDTYTGILIKSKLDSTTFAYRFWKDVWSGRINCDTFDAIRKGYIDNFGEGKIEKNILATDFENPYFVLSGFGGMDSSKRWRVNNTIPGQWHRINYTEVHNSPLNEHEINKQRVRQLLCRYGILFREILSNEAPHFQWAKLFKTLRIMELSGEILAGYFFEEVPGIQFICPSALQILKKGLPEDSVYRINATDPASLCTIAIPALSRRLPKRLISTNLFYHGTELVMISRKNGLELECFFSPDNPHTSRYIDLLKGLILRSVKPAFPLAIAVINKKPVYSSEYLPSFQQAGFTDGYRYIYYIK